MLKEITIGQHFPGDSPVHRLDPRAKLVLTVVFIVALFAGSNPLGLGLSALFLAAAYRAAGIPLKVIAKSLKPVLPILLFTAVLNLLFSQGDPLFSLGPVTVTRQGLSLVAVLTVRIICLIAGTGLLTYTTSPILLTDALEQLLTPLTRLPLLGRLPVHELVMVMTIALRFIPTLLEETDKIMSAQKARGAELDTGSLLDRVRALIPVLIPLFISAFRRADELAVAMECRCYRGGQGRTRLYRLRMRGSDLLLSAGAAAALGLIAFSGPLWGALGVLL